MLLSLLLALACSAPSAPDPDARLRAGDLQGTAAAWEAVHGAPLDVVHPAAEALAARAPRDPSITAAVLVESLDALRLLEDAPVKRTEVLDLTFDRLADLGAALQALGEGPTMFAVGRSESPMDRDPYTTDAELPWKGGRLVGYAYTVPGGASGTFAALGAKVDANPPAKLVTIAARDATGSVFLNVQRQGDIWSVISASNAHVGARLLLAASAVHDYGESTLRERQGRGIVRR